MTFFITDISGNLTPFNILPVTSPDTQTSSQQINPSDAVTSLTETETVEISTASESLETGSATATAVAEDAAIFDGTVPIPAQGIKNPAYTNTGQAASAVLGPDHSTEKAEYFAAFA